MKRFFVSALLAALFAAASCGKREVDPGKTIGTASAGNNLTVTLATATGALVHGKDEFTLTFADAAGKPVDVGAAAVNFFMGAMGPMAAMNHAATLVTTTTPGVYRGSVDLAMSGEWQAQVIYEGAAGTGRATLRVAAR